MKIPAKVAAIVAHPRTLRTLKVVRFLNTARGVVTAGIFVASIFGGGAFAVQHQENRAQASKNPSNVGNRVNPPPSRAPAATPSPSPTPDVRKEAATKLLAYYNASNVALEDMRKITVADTAKAKLDSILKEGEAKLKARYEQAASELAQVGKAAPPSITPASGPPVVPSTPPPGADAGMAVAVDAIYRAAQIDMQTITITTTRAVAALPTH